MADGLVLPRRPGNAGGGKEPWFESDTERKQGVITGESLTGSEKVRKLQTVLHAKAKEEPDRRFHALIDKVWREDFLMEAWRRVRRNGGAPGVDGETVADVESYGVERWLGELARDLKDGAYAPKPVRQVLIPKKQPGKFRPLGIHCIRDRVAQTSATLVLEPISAEIVLSVDWRKRNTDYQARPGNNSHKIHSTAVHPLGTLMSMKDTGLRIRVQRDLRDRFQRGLPRAGQARCTNPSRVHADLC